MKTSATSAKTSSFDIYEVITSKIIAKLEAGFIPWKKPWAFTGAASNYVTKRAYTGINALLLNFEAVDPIHTNVGGPQHPYYMTFLQAKEMGGTVKKGAKSEMVVFWNYIYTDGAGNKVSLEQAQGRGDIKSKAYLKYYNVFNVKDIEGIDFSFPQQEEKTTVEKLSACEQIIAGMPAAPRVQHGGDRAYYSPLHDYVNMPNRECFSSSEGYYSVFFHELTHATGHPMRLARKREGEYNPFGSELYSKEELVAELGAAFLCNHSGIESTIDNSAAYIQNWLKVLKNDTKLILEAAGAAQKGVDYILNRREY